jgi:hypothetical protein
MEELAINNGIAWCTMRDTCATYVLVQQQAQRNLIALTRSLFAELVHCVHDSLRELHTLSGATKSRKRLVAVV